MINILSSILAAGVIASGSTHEPFIFYTIAIILYLIITRVSNVAFDKAEIRYSRGFVKRKIS